jgi:hypothetical protein
VSKAATSRMLRPPFQRDLLTVRRWSSSPGTRCGEAGASAVRSRSAHRCRYPDSHLCPVVSGLWIVKMFNDWNNTGNVHIITSVIVNNHQCMLKKDCKASNWDQNIYSILPLNYRKYRRGRRLKNCSRREKGEKGRKNYATNALYVENAGSKKKHRRKFRETPVCYKWSLY